MAMTMGSKKAMRSQSALEYLSTYGWAILVIAVVFFAMFELGVFNQYALAPKVTSGSCTVYRPDGIGTIFHLSLSGSCNSGLPKFVAEFNGQNSYVTIGEPHISAPFSSKQITMTAWVMPYTANYILMYEPKGYSYCGASVVIVSPTFQDAIVQQLNTGSSYVTSSKAPNGWYSIAMTVNSSNYLDLYVNGALVNSTPMGISLDPANEIAMLALGTNYPLDCGGPGVFYSGYLSNVQIYNISLSAKDIQAMYMEGIGGDPINIRNLVGWWPLNGDTNDYSGDNLNGRATNITYSTTWYNSYAAP